MLAATMPSGRQKISARFLDINGNLIEHRTPSKKKSHYIGLSDRCMHRWAIVDRIVTHDVGNCVLRDIHLPDTEVASPTPS